MHDVKTAGQDSDITRGFTAVDYGSRLRHARLKKHLTRAEAETMLGLSAGAVREQEGGGVLPRFDDIVAFAIIYEVTLDWLIFGRTAEEQGEVCDLMARIVAVRSRLAEGPRTASAPSSTGQAIHGIRAE